MFLKSSRTVPILKLFNTNIVKKAKSFFERIKTEGKSLKIITVGSKGYDQLKRAYGNQIIEKISFKDSKVANYLDAEIVGKKIIELFKKNEFDICIAMSSTGLLMSYLADLNYIAYFCGHDIRSPPFIKDMPDPLSTDKPIYDFNSLERRYYKKAYDNAIAAVVTDDELLEHLKKYRKDAEELDR